MTVSESMLGGHKTLFFLTLYNSKNIGGDVAPPTPLLRGPCKNRRELSDKSFTGFVKLEQV